METESPAIVAFQEFTGRPHFPGVPGWEEVAVFSLSWAMNPTAIYSRKPEPALA